MDADFEHRADLARTVVPQLGRLVATGDPLEPYELVGPDGVGVAAGLGLLRRAPGGRAFGGDAALLWDGPVEMVPLPLGPRGAMGPGDEGRGAGLQPLVAGWGQTGPGALATARAEAASELPPLKTERYAASVRAHSETVLRTFYEFHLETGTGPIMNPFPLDRSRRAGRANARHNPMEPFEAGRVGRYRPKVPARVPRAIPDEVFNEIFARLCSNRDRALVAFYVSTGARASELLSLTQGGVDPGRQLVTVVRKGSREAQELPASPDAFVWLRLYQVEIEGLVPKGRRQPVFWTLRRPFRPLNYQAAHRMFARANDLAGTSATLHALRHTAAYRMAEDPALPLTDVQWVLGHARLSTTQVYLTPRKEDVVRRVLAHYGEKVRQAAERRVPPPAPGYSQESLDVLFERSAR